MGDAKFKFIRSGHVNASIAWVLSGQGTSFLASSCQAHLILDLIHFSQFLCSLFFDVVLSS